jgi:hypothetical protein
MKYLAIALAAAFCYRASADPVTAVDNTALQPKPVYSTGNALWVTLQGATGGGGVSLVTPNGDSAMDDTLDAVKVTGAVTATGGPLTVTGTTAADSPMADAPVPVGGRGLSSNPTAVSDSDVVYGWFNRLGAINISADRTGGQNADGVAGATTWSYRDATTVGQALPSYTASAVSNGATSGTGTWDPERGTFTITSTQMGITSSARASASVVNGSDITNYNSRGIFLNLSVTADGGGTNTLTLKVQGKNPTTSAYYDIASCGSMYANATDSAVERSCAIYPGVISADCQSIAGADVSGTVCKSAVIPRVWRVVVTPGTADSTTYSVSGVTVN